MPVVDMPLEQLQTYAGRNPRPADHDAYWERALKELDQTDPQPVLEPVDLPGDYLEAFDLWFTGVGGARIYAKYVRPKGKQGVPAVLQFHGYSWHSADWVDKLAYPAAGLAYAAMDCRGQGGRSEDVGGVKGNTLRGHIIRGLEDHEDKLYYRSVYLDTVQLARVVASFEEVDENRMGSIGGSQGGALAIACAALYPNIKRLAPTHPFLSDYLRVWEMDLDVAAFEELRTFFKHRDPRHERHDEWFHRLGYIDIQHLAPRIRAETVMALGLLDSITPPSTCFAAYNKIESPKRTMIYPDYGHEGLPGWPDEVYRFMCGL
jgi:cephalosporin-C deacetylase